MTSHSIDATIFASVHPDIEKRISVSGILSSALFIVIGMTSLILSNRLENESSILTTLLLLAGTILVILGVLRLVWKNKEVIYTPTGSVAKEKSFFFDLKYLDTLKEGVSTGQFATSSPIKSEPDGNIRMDVILSEDKKFAAIQLFQFVPYAYNPITSVYYYTNGDVAALSSFLQKSGCKAH